MTSVSAASRGDTAPGTRVTIVSRAVPFALVGVVGLVWSWALLATGSPLQDIVHWVGAVSLGILAPGFVVVRSCRRASAPLIEDLSWAAPVGCLVALGGWFLDRILPAAPAPFVVGPVVVAVGLALPATRRRILARPAPGWGLGPALVLSMVMLVATAWMLATGLRAYRPDPGPHGTLYSPDTMYQLTLVGELRHALVPSYPPVAGATLSYHWFLYAIDAHLLTQTGIDPFDSTLRLVPATLVLAILMLIAVVARRLCRQVWAGPVAAFLFGAVGITEGSGWTDQDGSTGVMPSIWRASPPQTLGWLAAIAAAGALFAFLRRSEDDRAVPVALLAPLFILTAGSKSSELPVLVAGIALATVVAVLRRDWFTARRCGVALVLGLAVFEAASLTIYSSSSYGIRLQPFGETLYRVGSMFPPIRVDKAGPYADRFHFSLIALGTVTLLFILPLLPRLVGLFFQVRYRPADPTGWVCLGTALAGLSLPFLLAHPSGSETYFLYSAYPIGVIGAASGLVVVSERTASALSNARTHHAVARWLCALALLGALCAAVVASFQPHFDPLERTAIADLHNPLSPKPSQRRLGVQWLTPTAELYCLLGVVALGAYLVVRRRTRRGAGVISPLRRPLLGLSLSTLLIGTGLFTATLQFYGTDVPPGGSPPRHRPTATSSSGQYLPTTRDALVAGRWVQRHARPDDVVATNMYCMNSRAFRSATHTSCDTRNFVAAALTERRTLVGGWGYSDRIVASAWVLPQLYRRAPFWDPTLLAEQYHAFAAPTAALLRRLYVENSVRWIYVDLRDKPVAVTSLDQLAILRFRGPTTAVWQLRPVGLSRTNG